MKTVISLKPVPPPNVDADFRHMNSLQRVTESFRYMLLRGEHWVSPSGDMREWLRRNCYVGACLLIPAVLVMPAIGLILWQVGGWLAMLTGIVGRLILFLLAFVVIRIVVAFLKR